MRFARITAMTRPTLLLSIGLSTALLASSVQADSKSADYDDYASQEETVGFFSGAILGGLAGGPPGAILGAAIGAFAGDGQQALLLAEKREAWSDIVEQLVNNARVAHGDPDG